MQTTSHIRFQEAMARNRLRPPPPPSASVRGEAPLLARQGFGRWAKSPVRSSVGSVPLSGHGSDFARNGQLPRKGGV